MKKMQWTPRIPHIAFEEQTERAPNRIAAKSARIKLTYRELNERANRLARYLRDNFGVRKGHSVGVCTAHEPSRLLALLAVAKCGGVYVPVDAECPQERMRYMINKAKLRIVLTDLSDCHLSTIGGLPMIDLTSVEAYSAANTSNLELEIDAHDALYIIFTSGSTGWPKGVAVSHAAAGNHFEWILRYLEISDDDCWLQSIHPCFDPSMHELFAPLMIGASVAFLGADRAIDSRNIVDAVQIHSATHITTVPTMFSLITQTPGFSACVSLRAICVGGEVFPPSLAATAQRLLPSAEIHNVYGPTETTIMASAWKYDGRRRDSLPIGLPVSNTRFYLRDSNGLLKEPKAGDEGELCISGAALANCYVNDVEETNKRFSANPLVLDSEIPLYSKIYSTGDLCRVDEIGQLHCIGRLDEQVKVNGQRVELGEVESAVRNSEGVADVAALVVDKRLIAAIVLRKCTSTSENWEKQISDDVARVLPLAWVPKQFVAVKEIPRLTTSGKTDRKALEKLFKTTVPAAAIASTSSLDARLARALSEVLGFSDHQKIDNDQPFAELGLDSLGVQRLSLRLHVEFKVDLRAEELFEFYTLKLLSDEVGIRLTASKM
jgi:amino acid adenylation domain-containing protein